MINAIKSRAFQVIFLIILTSGAYINTLQNGFAWDDKDFLLNWPQIKNAEDLPAYLSLPYLLIGDLPANHRGVYRPVRSVFYLVSYNFFGENPFPYHIQSIIMHTLIVLVLYFLTMQLTKKSMLSFLVAALFATHPIHTESVTNVTASFDNLGILFFFLSFYLYIKRKTLGSALYGFLAFFTYEMTLVLPLIVLLYEFVVNNYSLKKVLNKFHLYKHFILILIVYILIRFIILGIGNRADYLGIVWGIAANQVRVGMPEIFLHYLSWMASPISLTIARTLPANLLTSFLNLLNKIDPTGNLVNVSGQVAFIFPIIYASVALFIAFFFLKRYPLIFFAISWIIITLLPVSNIIPQGASLAERFLYIPSFGFVFLLGLLLYNGLLKYKRFAPFFTVLTISIIFFYSFQTLNRNFDWKNDKTIWQSAIKVDNTNPLPLRALASVYVRENEFEAGIELYKKALEVNYPSAQLNSELGLAYEKKGDMQMAIKYQQKALELSSIYYPSHIILGDIYLKQNKFEQAEAEYKKALEISKNDPRILLRLEEFQTLQEENKLR